MRQFSQRTEIVIRALKKNPEIFAKSEKHSNIRRAIIDKNNSLFYLVNTPNHKIYLLSFFDNRQDPKNMNIP